MAKASREFQVFVKPIGSICNLDCHYCYYLKKEQLYPKGESFRMPDDVLEDYIVQHIEAFREEEYGEAAPLKGAVFLLCGGLGLLFGVYYGVCSGADETLQIEGKSDSEIKEILEDLHKKARVTDFQ